MADRVLLTVVGLLALAAGGYGLARNLGAFGAAQSEAVLLEAEVRHRLVDNAGWVAGAATFLALVLAWAGWRWLRRQLGGSSSSLRRVRISAGAGGLTTVEARALAQAVEGDVQAGPEVSAARARVVGAERAPGLELAVDLAARADPLAVRRHVEEHVLPRARTALEVDELATRLRLRLGDRRRRGSSPK